VAYATQIGEVHLMVMDGRAGTEYQAVSPPKYGSDATLEYLALKTEKDGLLYLYRVKYIPTL
jgi:hypothetical protein